VREELNCKYQSRFLVKDSFQKVDWLRTRRKKGKGKGRERDGLGEGGGGNGRSRMHSKSMSLIKRSHITIGVHGGSDKDDPRGQRRGEEGARKAPDAKEKREKTNELQQLMLLETHSSTEAKKIWYWGIDALE